MGETKISLNIRFSPELDMTIGKMKSKGESVSKASIIKELINVFGKSLPQAESFMKPLRELDKDVSISFEGFVDGNLMYRR